MKRQKENSVGGVSAIGLAAILYCGSGIRADYTIVAGRVLVESGRLVGIDEEALFHRANEVAAALVRQAEETTGVSYLEPPG